MSLKAIDKLFLSIGGLALVLTSTWAFFQQSDISSLRTTVSAPASGTPYEKKEIKVEMPASQSWIKATAQPAGERWIYNVFTPPKIFYNTQSKQFTVIPPEIEVEHHGPEVVVGPVVPIVPKPDLELVKVDQPLFRLQLVGYIGDEGSYRGTFTVEQTGKTFFGTSGRKIPELNLEIVTFEAHRRKTEVPGGSPLIDVVAYAIVKDTKTGKEYRLDHDKRLPEGPPTATFKLADGSEKTLKSGDTIAAGDYTYFIGELKQKPDTVIVTKTGPSITVPQIETMTIPVPVAPVADPSNTGSTSSDGEMRPASASIPHF
jgi:hypothetical protein